MDDEVSTARLGEAKPRVRPQKEARLELEGRQ